MKLSEFFRLWVENYYQNIALIGKKGDFFTAVSVGNLFGTLLAKHFLTLIDKKILTPPLQVIEIGANEGYLSRDFLSALMEFRPEIFKDLEFFIIEPYEKLRALQRKTLQDCELIHKNSLQDCEFSNAYIFCNELFDSFSCELINGKTMAFVDDDFKLYFAPSDEKIQKECEELGLKIGELSQELNLFFKQLDKACKSFVLSGFDYGVLKPDKLSLRIYQKHEVFDPFKLDLKKFFGKSDLTYNVNFTHLLKLIKDYNFKLLAFEKQSQALSKFDFEEVLNHTKNKNIQSYENFLSQAKRLFFGFDDKFHFFEFQKI
ncbi:SAM-dependent methyltransferase [Campylobacter cuniculorum]|uniref:SAM-dependent methyltransferase n=2 Tax=Campylobacter cuniculorum TaxID=374106 RepID=A0A1W6BVE7_9BACT|nr:SAM-dependent methyltransferase [Campylobacter cuniculorum]ARJ56062.1 SAM-dependent methyltransferase [Campylobacter cuniculorum DSM 23162 = LMG 24588]QOR03563.1 SAM-dependent methyltransferase [Campylobacter cuniculorum]